MTTRRTLLCGATTALFLTAWLVTQASAQQTGPGDDPSAVPADQPTPTKQTDDGLIARLKRYVSGQRDAREGRARGGIQDPEGFYPRIGGLTTGSGLTLGGGYRTHLADRSLYADLSGVISTKWYLGLDGRLRLPSPSKRLEFWTSAALRRFTQEDFYGVGGDSNLADRANYALHSIDVGGQAIVKVTPRFHIGSDLGYFVPTIKAGTDPKFPTVHAVFPEREAPGLHDHPDYLHVGVFASMDSRDMHGNPHSGGFYRATLARWNDTSFDAYDFNRFDLEANHYVPLGSRRHVLAGRAGVSYVNNDLDQRVPFFVYPYVGGANTVRSFQEFRFRDENAMYLSGEYRFAIVDQVQLVGFIDRGKVARDWRDINLRGLKKAYGIGVRGGTATRTFARLDVGTGGGEGTRVFIKFFPTF